MSVATEIILCPKCRQATRIPAGVTRLAGTVRVCTACNWSAVDFGPCRNCGGHGGHRRYCPEWRKTPEDAWPVENEGPIG